MIKNPAFENLQPFSFFVGFSISKKSREFPKSQKIALERQSF